MKEIILTNKNRIEVLQAALGVLQNDGVIIYPTETSYGLGADFFSPTAVKKVYQVKGRDKDKPLSVIVSDFVYASSLVDFNHIARSLATQYWPGPLTLVLPFKHHHWQDYFDKFLALRVSSLALAQTIAALLACPLVATSANISGNSPSYRVDDIRQQFAKAKYQPDLFINAGDLEVNQPSTMIKCERDSATILRQGALQVNLNLFK
ncbi:MAG: L-threonylcarbamoyladenylate synthase [Patescibacteria group bacterium]